MNLWALTIDIYSDGQHYPCVRHVFYGESKGGCEERMRDHAEHDQTLWAVMNGAEGFKWKVRWKQVPFRDNAGVALD